MDENKISVLLKQNQNLSSTLIKRLTRGNFSEQNGFEDLQKYLFI